jgi:hypothetical protein
MQVVKLCKLLIVNLKSKVFSFLLKTFELENSSFWNVIFLLISQIHRHFFSQISLSSLFQKVMKSHKGFHFTEMSPK